MKKIVAALLATLMLIPAVALGEATALPFDLKLGMNTNEAKAIFASDAILAAMKPDEVDSGTNAVEFVFENVAVPGTTLTASSLSVQIDQNNSDRADRLTSISFVLDPDANSIKDFRTLLEAMTTTYGAPASDPFNEDGASAYEEWGTLDATWTMPDVRVSLSLNRMYEESITIQYSSRVNYSRTDLQ